MKKKLTEAELIERDAGRNIGEELLQAVREIKAGKTGRVFNVEVTELASMASSDRCEGDELQRNFPME